LLETLQRRLVLLQRFQSRQILRQRLRIDRAELRSDVLAEQRRSVQLCNVARVERQRTTEICAAIRAIVVRTSELLVEFRERLLQRHIGSFLHGAEHVRSHALLEIRNAFEQLPGAALVDLGRHVAALGVLLALGVGGMRAPHARRLCELSLEETMLLRLILRRRRDFAVARIVEHVA
jgi:hypothetical protein